MRRIDAVVEGLGDPARRATVKFRLGSFLAWGTGELEEAEAAFRHARDLFEEAGDRTSALLAANELAWVRGLEGDLPAFEAEARRVAEAAEAMGEPFALTQALSAMGVAAGWRGRLQEGEEAWRRSMAIAAEEGKPYRVAIARLSLAMSHALTGRIDEATALLEEAKSLSPGWRESPLPEWESIVLWASADFRGAVASARKAAPSALGTPSRRRALGLSYAALSAVEADLEDEAERIIAQCRGAYGDRDWAHYRDYARYARARPGLATGLSG
jgi:tetratricopeptide (TPR) repeat protein